MSFIRGEYSDVLASREAFFDALGIDLSAGAMIACLHGLKIAKVGSSDRGRGMTDGKDSFELDCLVTTDVGVALSLLTADCIPLILYSPRRRVLALVHIGWRNADKNFAKLVVEYLQEHCSVAPAELLAWIGPSIKAQSYVFDDAVQKDLPDWQPYVHRRSDGRYAIDLVGFNVAQLEECGLTRQNIEVSPIDTGSDSNFFSHYVSAHTSEPEGRLVTVAAMTDE